MERNALHRAVPPLRALALLPLMLMLMPSFIACSTRHLVVDQVSGMVQTGITAFEQDDDLALVEKAMPANIKLLEVMLANQPDHTGMLVLLARLYGSYAFAFAEGRLEAATLAAESGNTGHACAGGRDTFKTMADRYYRKGREYAVRALASRYPEARESLKNIRTSGDFLNRLKPTDVPALFWYAFNLGGHVNLNLNSVRVLAQAHLAEKAAKRVIELAPDYFNGGAHLFLMVYHGSRSPMMGGNPNAARDHYRQLKSTAGEDFLMADLLYARTRLYQARDRKGFETMLESVVNAPSTQNRYPLYNAVARKRARLYLEFTDTFFE
jgi:TRAP transporter T-component